MSAANARGRCGGPQHVSTAKLEPKVALINVLAQVAKRTHQRHVDPGFGA